MSRLLSVSMTEQPVIARTKTVTRRRGWWLDKHGRRLVVPGDTLTLVRKAMGRKPGEPLVRLAEVEVLDVRREPLWYLDIDCRPACPGGDVDCCTYGRDEVALEGFPGMDPAEFVDRFFVRAQGMRLIDDVTRIEWRYLDREAPTPGRIWTDSVDLPGGSRQITVKRCCNGCGRELGDVLDAELDAAVRGLRLPDVTAECGCTADGEAP